MSGVFVCVCARLYAPAEPRQSSSTEAKLNGEGRLKAVPGPAASVFNHRSPPHLSLHADQAAVKGAMHPATPIHKCPDSAVMKSDFYLSKHACVNDSVMLNIVVSSDVPFGCVSSPHFKAHPLCCLTPHFGGSQQLVIDSFLFYESGHIYQEFSVTFHLLIFLAALHH